MVGRARGVGPERAPLLAGDARRATEEGASPAPAEPDPHETGARLRAACRAIRHGARPAGALVLVACAVLLAIVAALARHDAGVTTALGDAARGATPLADDDADWPLYGSEGNIGKRHAERRRARAPARHDPRRAADATLEDAVSTLDAVDDATLDEDADSIAATRRERRVSERRDAALAQRAEARANRAEDARAVRAAERTLERTRAAEAERTAERRRIAREEKAAKAAEAAAEAASERAERAEREAKATSLAAAKVAAANAAAEEKRTEAKANAKRIQAAKAHDAADAETKTKTKTNALPARREAGLGVAVDARPKRHFPEPFEDDDASDAEDLRASAAEVAARARTALKSKSEPLLDDSAPVAADAAANAVDDDVDEPSVVVGRVEPVRRIGSNEEDTKKGLADATATGGVSGGSSTSSDVSSDVSSDDSSDVSVDAFGLGDSAVYVDAGAWAETAPHAVTLGGRPHAVMHLTLRDGDRLFASENMPWAEALVNGARVRLPHQLSAGDVVSLRVRAESKAEIEAEEVALEEGKERVDPVRAATLRYGNVEGTLRTRVRDRSRYVLGYREARVARSKAAFENLLAEDADREEARGAANEAAANGDDRAATGQPRRRTEVLRGRVGDADAAGGAVSVAGVAAIAAETSASVSASDSDSTPTTLDPTPPPALMSFALPGAKGAASKLLRVVAPVPGQWMVIPPVDRPPVYVSGLGEGVRKPITVRFSDADDASESAEGSDGRRSPEGESNGVFAKVNGRDLSVKPKTIQVWTREETMEVSRAGAASRTTVDVADGDRVRLRVRAPAAGLEPATVAVFVGEHWVGTAVVSSAATAEEASAASDALRRELDAARALALDEERDEKRDEKDENDASSNPAGAGNGDGDANRVSAAGLAQARADADADADADASPPSTSLPSVASLVTHRKITAEDMSRHPRGATRVVEAGSTVLLPTNGFMVVAGVLQSTELALRVHAYEQFAGRDIRDRAADDEAEGSTADVEEEGWRTAKLGASPTNEGRAGARGAEAEASAEASIDASSASASSSSLPDWVEVRVEGAKVTPPVPVWLARRVNVRVRASDVGGVARRVVVRAGEQTWQATIVSEAKDEAKDSADPRRGGESESESTRLEVLERVASADDDRDRAQAERIDALEEDAAKDDVRDAAQASRLTALESKLHDLADVLRGEESAPRTTTTATERRTTTRTTTTTTEERPESESGSESGSGSDSGGSSSSVPESSSPPTRSNPFASGSFPDVDPPAASASPWIATSAAAASIRASRRSREIFFSAPPKNHTVVADAETLVFLPTPFPRDATAAATARVNSAGGVDGYLSPSLTTRYGDGGAGVRVRGLGPDGSCRVGVAWRDARSPALAAGLPLPAWARVTVNGTFANASPLFARDGDALGVALVTHPVAGAAREVLVDCVVENEEVAAKEKNGGGAAKEDAGGDEPSPSPPSSPADPSPASYLAPGDVAAVFSATATTRPAPPPPPPPPPFPPAADVIASEGAKTTPACDSTGERARRQARRLILNRTDIFSHDASKGEPPDACAAEPACASAGDDDADDDRDVVFVVDASDAMGPEAFRTKTMDVLQSLYCASHEGSRSRASVVLYPAPRNAKTCGAYEVAIPLARYTPLEWRDLVENLRRDPDACCGGASGGAAGGSVTAAAPLAEALDGAGLELAERGAFDPSKRLVVIVSAGLPSPMVRDESCAEDADPAFASMTRHFPFSRAASDGGEVTACSYLWRYVPAAANRLKATGARVAAVNIAGDAGARESTAGSAAASYLAGEPWPGACDPDGFCSVQATYGGERGRWVYRAANEREEAEKNEEEEEDEARARPADEESESFGFGRAASRLGAAPGGGLAETAPGGLASPRPEETIASLASSRVDSDSDRLAHPHRRDDSNLAVARLGSADASARFAYDPGAPETCVATLPSGDAATRGRAVVSFPVSAHLVTLHGDAGGGASSSSSSSAARVVAPLMCEPSSRVTCALEEDAGLAPTAAQCGGGFSAEDAATCLRGMVHAACRALDVADAEWHANIERAEEAAEAAVEAARRADRAARDAVDILAKSNADSSADADSSSIASLGSASRSGSSDEVCFSDGRLLVSDEGFSSDALYGAFACNRVCRPATGPDAADESKRRALGRAEVEVKCEPGRACETGRTRWFARGSDADARRRDGDGAAEEVWPDEDKERFADAPAPEPEEAPFEEIDSEHGFGR